MLLSLFIFTKLITVINHYSRSFLFGFLEGSLDKKPKKNNDMKKITVV